MDEASTSPSTDHCDTTATKSLNNEIDVKQRYPMRGKTHSFAVIFCHETFYANNEEMRVGVKADCDRLESILKTLNFEVKIYKDQTKNKILNKLNEVSQMDLSDKDCLLIVVLTHGHSGLLCAYDQPYNIIDLWNSFSENNCPSLRGKPKLFFVQACRGDDVDSGTKLQYQENTQFKQQLSSKNSLPDASVHKLSAIELEALRTPDERDFLIGYSSAPDYISFKNGCGSWFIQEICSIFEIYGKNYDLLTLLTFVSQRVALNYLSCNPEKPKYHKKKQVPCIVSTLTKQLYFFPEQAKEVSEDFELK